MSVAIVTLSFDEGNGVTASQLDALCLTTPWCIALGYILIYMALFSKLWRINKVLQFSRRKVEVRHVVAPFLVIIGLTVTVLLVWTVLHPFLWVREIVDPVSGASYGRCSSGEHTLVYMIVILTLMVITTVATGMMAWKTKDIDERFAEAKWIFYTIFVQIQLLLLGIPVLVILNSDSSSEEATYLGRSLLLFLIVFTTISMMIGPKVVRVYDDLKTEHKAKKSGISATSATARSTTRSGGRGGKRGSAGGTVQVTGLRGPDSTESITDPFGHQVESSEEPKSGVLGASSVFTNSFVRSSGTIDYEHQTTGAKYTPHARKRSNNSSFQNSADALDYAQDLATEKPSADLAAGIAALPSDDDDAEQQSTLFA